MLYFLDPWETSTNPRAHNCRATWESRRPPHGIQSPTESAEEDARRGPSPPVSVPFVERYPWSTRRTTHSTAMQSYEYAPSTTCRAATLTPLSNARSRPVSKHLSQTCSSAAHNIPLLVGRHRGLPDRFFKFPSNPPCLSGCLPSSAVQQDDVYSVDPETSCQPAGQGVTVPSPIPFEADQLAICSFVHGQTPQTMPIKSSPVKYNLLFMQEPTLCCQNWERQWQGQRGPALSPALDDIRHRGVVTGTRTAVVQPPRPSTSCLTH
ncbi:hypothetical protein QBC47DRAFT_114505 [Echria macrotheca]|uniref:Uncharacterized protein n=1 Tax=Echria macrotheca TaxID=438768 RepID=A0AAJ0FFC1_9PEZI|nr:hypothetical protein QBC47DRAFT_114505 [Echria macrotheca]